MAEFQKVCGSHKLSVRAAELLEDMRPQLYNGANHAETVQTINDILRGRTDRTPDAFLTGLRNTDNGGYTRRVDELGRDIRAFLEQKALLTRPYTKSSGKQYQYRTSTLDPERPLKIVDQRIYDSAAKAGFPPGFFRETYFDRVTFYCVPDHTDFKFSHFPGCTFAVCRIREAAFDGASFYLSEFQNCAVQYATFFAASIDHTHFHDSSLKNVSFQGASLKSCNTVDCELDGVGFLNAALDGCFFGRVSARNIRNLNTAAITQGGATKEKADRSRDSVLTALLPWRAAQQGVPEKKRGGR